MTRRQLLAGATCTIAAAAAQQKPVRTLKVCAAADADPRIRKAAEEIAAGSPINSLLNLMGRAASLTDTHALASAPQADRAYSHLIIAGLPNDPLIQLAWQREAKPEPGGFFIFGFGHLRGDIGYVESDRNPFLHSASIATAPFETEVITITGSTPAGVELAARSFLQQELINGVIAYPGWTRPLPTLLDRDPLSLLWVTPEWVPKDAGNLQRIGVTQASEDEYRGVLADTGSAPKTIWRIKYFPPGGWDVPGLAGAFDGYAAGLHRRSYANTLWLAQFSSPGEAANAAPRIAAAAKLKLSATGWAGEQPSFANGTYPGEHAALGPLALTQRQEWLILNNMRDVHLG